MKTNITPGKWEITQASKNVITVSTQELTYLGRALVWVNAENIEAEANAQAIASLPDIMRENEELKAINDELLKALKVLINFCSFIPKETFTESGKNDFQALLKNGAEVIAKATK